MIFQAFHTKAAACVALMLLLSSGAQADDKTIVIGSGGATGVYYPVAISICRLFNAENKKNGYRCSVESTKGSIDNLKKLRAGTINFAIVQSDWQSHALKGTNVFANAKPHKDLRSLFALYSESFTVLARSNSKIARFEDLLGRRVNLGDPGSGQRATMDIVMRAFGWTRFSFSLTREFGSKLQAQALCDGEVDAIVFVAGHPSGTIKSATEKCSTNLVEVDGPVIDKLIEENDYYRKAVIPTSVYFKENSDIPTFGVNATMVATSQVPSSLLTLFLKSVFGNLDKFKTMHPALASLSLEEMKKDIMPAPLHDGAKFFFEKLHN